MRTSVAAVHRYQLLDQDAAATAAAGAMPDHTNVSTDGAAMSHQSCRAIKEGASRRGRERTTCLSLLPLSVSPLDIGVACAGARKGCHADYDGEHSIKLHETPRPDQCFAFPKLTLTHPCKLCRNIFCPLGRRLSGTGTRTTTHPAHLPPRSFTSTSPPYITPGNKEDAVREGVEQSQRCKRCLVAKLGLDSERHLLQIYRAGRGREGSAYDGGTRTYMLQRKHSDLFVYSSRIRATATVHNLL